MKNKAIELRRSGESIKVIAKKLGKASSTVHAWVKDVPLSDEIKKNLKLRANKAAVKKKVEDKKKLLNP